MFDRLTLTVMIGEQKPYDVELSEYNKALVTFGRNPGNDLVIDSPIASGSHGALEYAEGRVYISDYQSTNGVYVNQTRIGQPTLLAAGDMITFESPAAKEAGSEAALLHYGVILTLNASQAVTAWETFRLTDQPATIGRDETCSIHLNQISVSRFHATIAYVNGAYCLYDNGSTNGVFVNGARVVGGAMIKDRDVIFIANAKMYYSRGLLHYSKDQPGIGVDVANAVRTVRTKEGPKTILDNVSFSLKPKEFVAIIGGSGAGKSTLMNGMCGFSRFSGGQVAFENEDLYKNYEILKNLVGYVPQQDIVHKDLTLRKMLMYTAEMRMPQDTTREEREKRVEEVIGMVELTGRENTLIKDLSGGQRKRASIAVELVSDPTVFFLDEPSSGLDPGTERNLMYTLKNMTKKNKTIVVITHMTLNIGICDKVILLGRGGRLCFFGTPQEALKFFNVTDFVDIYDQLNSYAPEWQAHFQNNRSDFTEPGVSVGGASPQTAEKNKHSAMHQFGVLCRRYISLIISDKKRLLMLLLQAPLLGLLLALVSYKTDTAGNVTVFTYSSEAKALLFSLACAAFWVGMLNSVQEICKERDIFNRERLAKLKLGPYLASKLVVLGGMCLLQSLLLLVVTSALTGLPPSNELSVSPAIGMYITTFLTAFSAVAIGLAVSCASPNPDRAMTLAPLILMPQILFSGIAFELEGFSAFFSNIINCRWAVRAYYVLADINNLPANADATGSTFEDVAYTASKANLFGPWGALLAISVVCILFSICILSIRTEE